MFIEPTTTGYDRSGEQVARRAMFLILVQPEGQSTMKDIRAIVRKVALRQCGHWMMGSCRIRGHRITISGSYGSDGLPRTVPDAVYNEAVPVPADLLEQWNKGGGWNSAGAEGPSMREWARANLAALYRVKQKAKR